MPLRDKFIFLVNDLGFEILELETCKLMPLIFTFHRRYQHFCIFTIHIYWNSDIWGLII